MRRLENASFVEFVSIIECIELRSFYAVVLQSRDRKLNWITVCIRNAKKISVLVENCCESTRRCGFILFQFERNDPWRCNVINVWKYDCIVSVYFLNNNINICMKVCFFRTGQLNNSIFYVVAFKFSLFTSYSQANTMNNENRLILIN